jgi:hypothetical protein
MQAMSMTKTTMSAPFASQNRRYPSPQNTIKYLYDRRHCRIAGIQDARYNRSHRYVFNDPTSQLANSSKWSISQSKVQSSYHWRSTGCRSDAKYNCGKSQDVHGKCWMLHIGEERTYHTIKLSRSPPRITSSLIVVYIFIYIYIWICIHMVDRL